MAYELIPAERRKDFFCTDCGKLTSLYLGRGQVTPRKRFCAWCGDSIAMVPYTPRKHGYISGRSSLWSTGDIKVLEELLKQPLTWADIARRLDRPIGAVRRHASRMGFQKTYQKAGRPKTDSQ